MFAGEGEADVRLDQSERRSMTHCGGCAERRVACRCWGRPVLQHGVTLAQRRRTRPEISVETKLNGVDVLRVRPEGRFGLPLNRRLSKFILVRNGVQF